MLMCESGDHNGDDDDHTVSLFSDFGFLSD